MSTRASFSAALAALGLLVCAPAQDVRIANLANLPRKQWVDIAVPISIGATLPEFCQIAPYGFPAWRGRHVGLHSTMFHAYVELGPDQMLDGRLVPATIAAGTAPDWGMSDWVGDDAVGVIPRPVVLAGGRECRLQSPTFRLVEENRARKVFHLRGRLAGTPLVFDEWLYVYSYQDVVRFEMTLTNSDPRTPDLSWNLDLLWLEVREPVSIDYRKAQGLLPPVEQNALAGHPSSGHWVQPLSGPRVMGRSEQLFFSGSILCRPRPRTQPRPVVYQAGGLSVTRSVAERNLTLLAASRGPVHGLCTEWDGHWLAFGMTPELPAGATNGGWSAAYQSARSFNQLLRRHHDLYDQRPRGLLLRAGSTGSQEDFGACKGALAVTVGDPRFLREAGYSLYEIFARPFHNREVDGSPMLASNHPGLTTWSQRVHCFTTQDTLGMNCPFPYSWPSNGYSGIDDQHRSQNNANMMLALTGSYALRAAFKDLLEIDLAMVPNRADSPRAEGRLHIAWANMILLLDSQGDRARLYYHMRQRLANLMAVWPGRRFLGDPTRPIRAMHIGSDPTFLEPNGDRVPAIIVWEHSIAVMGYYAAWRITGDRRYHDMAAEVAKMIVNHCIFQENGQWIACTAIRYLQGAQEGRALPRSTYYTGSPDVHVSISFWTWIYPAVLICRDLWRHQDPALVARCDAIVAQLGAPDSWGRAEWWAVLPR